MKYLITAITLMISLSVNAQEIGVSGAKEYNKEVSLYKAKEFYISNILELEENGKAKWFTIDALAAASSGELTTLIVDCVQKTNGIDKQIGGLVIGFYGSYWDKGGSGAYYTEYSFKFFTPEKAIGLFEKIDSTITKFDDWLKRDPNNNNIVFKYDDVKILITLKLGGSVSMRVFWNGFDADWEQVAFERTKKRYIKKSK